MEPVAHELKTIKRCSLFDSEHAHADGYFKPHCSCDWIGTAVCGHKNAIALHTAHVEARKREAQKIIPVLPVVTQDWIEDCVGRFITCTTAIQRGYVLKQALAELGILVEPRNK
jgi:hypothetical protein